VTPHPRSGRADGPSACCPCSTARRLSFALQNSFASGPLALRGLLLRFSPCQFTVGLRPGPVARRSRRAPHALHRCPRLDQVPSTLKCSFTTVRGPRLAHDPAKQLAPLRLDQTVTVLRKARVIPDRLTIVKPTNQRNSSCSPVARTAVFRCGSSTKSAASSPHSRSGGIEASLGGINPVKVPVHAAESSSEVP